MKPPSQMFTWVRNLQVWKSLGHIHDSFLPLPQRCGFPSVKVIGSLFKLENVSCERIPVCRLWRRGGPNILSRDFVHSLVIKKVSLEAELSWPGYSSLNTQRMCIHQKAGPAVTARFLWSFGDGASLVLVLYSQFSLQGLQDWLQLWVCLLLCLPGALWDGQLSVNPS